MENKYFTPDIEDIRVGYEAEVNWEFYRNSDGTKSSTPDGWKPVVFKGVDEAVRHYHSLGMYRVPYLTKEQIEAEGWKPLESKFYPKGDSDTRNFQFEKDNFILTFYQEEKVVFFIAKDVTKLEWMCVTPRTGWGHGLHELFRCTLPCKDINTFRQICKLLGV